MTTQTLSFIEVVDASNQFTGQLSDPNEATNKGLWHRGAHVILYTSDGHIVVQKRSLHIVQSPGKLALGAGGFVDAGESPAQAAIREVYEETGVIITENDLKF